MQDTDQERQPLLTSQDVADYCRVPLATVRSWRYRGTGPMAYKVGRHVRYSRVAVDTWLAANC